MNKLKTTALAAALVAMSAPASSAVIATNADGWEISFGGTINLFANFYDRNNIGGGGDADEFHLQEGLLPAFATFKAKSPTINGLTGTAQISFAPDSSGTKERRQDKNGSSIDMREVFFNVEGSFGTISVGRTLGIFSRSAILKDQTLFGVGAAGDESLGGGGTSLGRIAHGYVYPAFDTRFSYKTPDMNGFQVEVGLYDPLENGLGEETDIPRLEFEATYGTTFGAGGVNFWLGGLWQETDNLPGAGDVTHWGIDVGAQATFGGFELVGHYTEGENLGQLFKISAPVGTEDNEDSHWYVQAGYTFAGATKVALSYGESETQYGRANGALVANGDTTNELFTVGVYHDVNSWLKLVAEYNDTESEQLNNESDVFSVGAFIFW